MVRVIPFHKYNNLCKLYTFHDVNCCYTIVYSLIFLRQFIVFFDFFGIDLDSFIFFIVYIKIDSPNKYIFIRAIYNLYSRGNFFLFYIF